MDNGRLIEGVLDDFNIPSNILKRYYEEHRFYHTIEHIHDMVGYAQKHNIVYPDLILAIVFHDIVYNPQKDDNEEQSAKFFVECAYRSGCFDKVRIEYIKNAILETKHHNPTNKLSSQLCECDLQSLHKPLGELIKNEELLFKEYQFVDYETYKVERVKFLKTLKGIDFRDYISYIENRKRNIGVYAGSFNPFHKGHLNILKKAERIFDKVIIARGINTDKNNEFVDLPESIKNRQVVFYDGLLTDCLNELGDVTLIRGLRNSDDFNSEKTQLEYLKYLDKNIKVMFLMCDNEYQHISSSGIRTLQKFDKGGDLLV